MLTSEQRIQFMKIPSDISKWELASYYTLSPQDINLIKRRRRDHNRLGFAIQLCLLRFPGWTLSDANPIPNAVLNYIADQIHVNAQEFQYYAGREQTKYEHLEEIRKFYGYTFFSMSNYRQLSRYLLPFAMENNQSLHLIKIAIDEMRKQKIILPAMTTVERLVWEIRRRAEKKVYQRLTESLTSNQKQQLDTLTEPSDEQRRTPLSWLREKPGQSSPDAFLDAIKRLEYVREINLSSNTKEIHPNRLLQLSRMGARYEPHSFRRFKESKRYAILVAYLLYLSQELIDQAIEIHDRQIMVLQSKGRKAQEELQKQHGKSINEKVIHFADLGAALIKARDEGLDPFETLETVMPWENIISSVEEARKLSRPVDYDYLDLLENRFSYLRKYTPTLLNALDFQSNQSAEPLMEAIDTIRTMNQSGKRRVPEDAPLDFISNRWQKHVYDEDGSINRRYYEMAALTELRNHIRSGDVSVTGSRQYKNFDEYLISKDEWKKIDLQNSKLAVSPSVDQFISERTQTLTERLNWVSNHVHELEGVNIGKGKLHIDRLEKNTPEEAKSFSLSLYKMLPKIKLTDLLLEVASWTGFDEAFLHASSGHPPKGNEKSILMATLMGMGTNIGLTKMADATPKISYHQMANIAQWRMHDDAMNKAQAALVDFHHQLLLPSYWGDGTTSSSDGMRVQVGVPSLYADANPHYGHGKGTTFYRFTSDQFSTFSGNVVNTNSRDALHVVDGLLHHESELNIEEHYTDTAGYTDQVFGLCHLLGFRFAPRLRDLTDTRLHIMGKPNEFPKLESLLKGRINTKVIQENYADVLRMGQSVGQGKVSAALILGKLGSYSRQNNLATALREMGRIEKTIFILDYISNEAIRRRIQRGLNKGEAMNALARALFFGKRGELRERALQDQLQRNSALNILINAISVWNTVYLTEAIKVMREKGVLKEELIGHVSPLGWEHINFLGEYSFDLKNLTKANTLRPLNI